MRAPEGVQVVRQQVVAGLDATVLQASDPAALDGWLRGNGYPSGPELRGWLERYVVKGWFVTAFKIRPGNRAQVATRAVRMSFHTELPFYPYAEPAPANGVSCAERSVIGLILNRRLHGICARCAARRCA